MTNIFNKLFKRKETKPVAIEKPVYSFIEQYTVVVPSTVIVDYWFPNKNTFATYENNKHNYSFYDCVILPTEAFLIYCYKYNKASNKIKNDKKMRTISVVTLPNNDKLFIFPDPENPKKPMFFNPKTLPFIVTPEINRAIVDTWKTYSR